MDWTLTDIRASVRELTGRPTTGQLSNTKLDESINHYYQNVLPFEVDLPVLDDWLSFSTTAGTGEYSIVGLSGGRDVNFLRETVRILLDDLPISRYRDINQFFAVYPRDTETSAYYGQPEAVCVMGGALYLRPIPDDVYTVRFFYNKRPTALTSASDLPYDGRWGEAIAHGAAVIVFIKARDYDAAAPLQQQLREVILPRVFRPTLRGFFGQRAAPGF